jgi:hypothetical protein
LARVLLKRLVNHRRSRFTETRRGSQTTARHEGVVIMSKRLIGAFILVVGSVAGCATSPAGSSVRGTVLASSPGSRAIVTGPITVHAYAGFAGGEIYNTRAAAGTDVDCARAPQSGAAIPLPADKVVSVTVAEGEVACLRTQASRGYELLWHSQPQPPSVQLMATATSRRPR